MSPLIDRRHFTWSLFSAKIFFAVIGFWSNRETYPVIWMSGCNRISSLEIFSDVMILSKQMAKWPTGQTLVPFATRSSDIASGSLLGEQGK